MNRASQLQLNSYVQFAAAPVSFPNLHPITAPDAAAIANKVSGILSARFPSFESQYIEGVVYSAVVEKMTSSPIASINDYPFGMAIKPPFGAKLH